MRTKKQARKVYDLDFVDMTLERGKLRVTFEYLGEGESGDYNEDDPDDVPLLRFSVDRRERAGAADGWCGIDDGSYCTQLPIDTNQQHLAMGLESILREAEEGLEDGTFKRRMEFMSWIGPADFAVPPTKGEGVMPRAKDKREKLRKA